MNVNYDDERFTNLETEKQNELNQYNQVYDNLINERNQLTEQQQAYVDNWKTTQEQIANDNLNHQLDLYNQQKEKAEQDYQKEARASYADYQKEVDKYGVSRENVMSNGLANSGYAESSKVDMYNTYQNRLASARQSLNDIRLEFDNAIKEAQLQNNASLAELALQQMEQKLSIALEGFNYKDAQTQNKLNWQNTINNNYYNRYLDVQDQINYENQQAEAIRQYNEQMEYQKQQDALAQQRWEQEMAYQREQDAIANAQRWASVNSSSSSGSNSYETLIDGSEELINSATKPSTAKAANAVVNAAKNALNTLFKGNSGKNNTQNLVTLKTNYSPKLSSDNANNWLNNYVTPLAINGNLTADKLASLLETGQKNNILTNNDVDLILKSFGY